MNKLILILALLFSTNLVAQERMGFTERPFKLVNYSIGMSIPIVGYSVLYKGEKDKLYHFIAGYGTVAIIGGVLRKYTDKMWIQIPISLLSGIAINGIKELSDKHLGTGVYNPKDFTAGYWGSVFGTVVYMINISDKPIKKIK